MAYLYVLARRAYTVGGFAKMKRRYFLMQAENRRTNDTPKFYALLIGIDCYLPNALPNGTYYPSLDGCVRDIIEGEAFLKSTVHLPEQQIIKLTASNSGTTEPREPREQWPTYENMVAAFRHVTQ